MAIPVVDLFEFTRGDLSQKNDLVARLGKAFEDVGFVAVRNHGISDEMVADMYKGAESFFGLPEEQKMNYQAPETAGQRGYTSFGKEHAKGYDAPDLKEFFQFGQETAGMGYPPNVHVKELPEFTPTMLRAYKAFEQAGTSLLQAIALYLQLDEHYFDAYTENGNSILRAIYYPPITMEPRSSIRAEQHEDINLITLLVGSSADGLQILNMMDEWVPVTSLEDQIVVNVGDMLQRLTNNKLRSTTHRVVNPPKDKWGTPRYSIPFFLHPRRDMSLACLESCITDSEPKLYEDITAGAYLDERLMEIGLKK